MGRDKIIAAYPVIQEMDIMEVNILEEDNGYSVKFLDEEGKNELAFPRKAGKLSDAKEIAEEIIRTNSWLPPQSIEKLILIQERNYA